MTQKLRLMHCGIAHCSAVGSSGPKGLLYTLITPLLRTQSPLKVVVLP